MLQKIGDSLKGSKWVTYTILGVLALVFGAWGVYGVVDFGFGGSSYAAKVNGHTISLEEFRQAWSARQAELLRDSDTELPPEMRRLMQDELLESFVQTTLLTERSRDLGYRVTNEQIHEVLRNEPAFQVDGKYDPAVAKSVLERAGISVAQYEADLRRGLLGEQLQTAIQISNFLTPQEYERIEKLRNEQRQLRYAIFPAEKYAGDAPVEDEAIQAYYEGHKSQFMTTESVRLQYAELRRDQIASQVELTEDDLKQFYEENKVSYVTPEKRRARHILIETGEGVDDAAALKEAEDVLAKAKAGEDFAALAKQHSDDAGSAAQGGDLGFAERTYFVAPFADALFSMNVGEIRGPVKTEYGYHIIRLEAIEAGSTRTFEEAREEIEAQLKTQRADERFRDIEEQIAERLEQPGASLETLAKEFNLQMGEVPEFLRGSGGGALGNDAELQKVVFSDEVLSDRRIGGPVPLGEERLVLVSVLDHKPATPKPLTEVRDQIVAELLKTRGTQAAMKSAEAARERLETGASFEEVIKEAGLSADPARYVGRQDPSVPGQIRTTAFQAPKPTQGAVYRTVRLDEGGVALVAITDSRVESPAEMNPMIQQAIRQSMAARNSIGDMVAYMEQARREADVKKNPLAFE